MSDMRFNLVSDPWIVVRRNGRTEEVGLAEAFADAHRIESLGGDLPTQDVAVLRVMLAVVHRAVEGLHGFPHERWATLWNSPSLPLPAIGAYLDAWRHRFDLFDPVAPFMQVAGLSAAKTSGLTKLIADVPDGWPFFTTRAGTALQAMPFGEAARWLIHCMAYDVSGIKTGARGDDRVKGGKGYPIGTGWAGRCGLVVVEYQSLRDMLLLNLVLTPRESDAEPDVPVWERPPLTAAADRSHPEPLGATDVMTWPSRRILLHHDGSKVTDVLISNGDRIEPQNRHLLEPMSAFRRSPNQERQAGGATVYMPHRHDPSRALWRGLGALLTERPRGGAVRNEPPEHLPPLNLAWLGEMREERVLDPDLPVRLRAVGISYGTQDSSIEAMYDDSIRIHVAVATDPDLRHAALRASACADDAVAQLASLAANIARAAGRDADGPRTNAREDAFTRLDAPYRTWVSSLTIGSDLESAQRGWQRTVRGHVLSVAADTIRAGGEAAFIGREVRGRYVDSARAELWFRSGLRKSLPLAGMDESSKEQS